MLRTARRRRGRYRVCRCVPLDDVGERYRVCRCVPLDDVGGRYWVCRCVPLDDVGDRYWVCRCVPLDDVGERYWVCRCVPLDDVRDRRRRAVLRRAAREGLRDSEGAHRAGQREGDRQTPEGVDGEHRFLLRHDRPRGDLTRELP